MAKLNTKAPGLDIEQQIGRYKYGFSLLWRRRYATKSCEPNAKPGTLNP